MHKKQIRVYASVYQTLDEIWNSEPLEDVYTPVH